jgi:S1-C subfamily serine protease
MLVRNVMTRKLSQAIEYLAPTVVQIMAGDSRGTGFFVSEDAHVVTAAHVVGDIDVVNVGLAHKNTDNMRANWSIVEANVLRRDTTEDLALLRLRINPFREGRNVMSGIAIDGNPLELPVAVAKLDAERPVDGEAIAISGYPLTNPVLITTSGALASVWPLQEVDEGDVSPYSVHRILDLYIADVQANPGNSGGPAYRIADGRVIGVCIQVQGAPTFNEQGPFAQLSVNAGLTVLRPARSVIELLAAEGIEVSSPKSPSRRRR